MEMQVDTNQDKVKVFNSKVLISKSERYKWIIKDVPGELMFIHKDELTVDVDYQREGIVSKILHMAKAWSWIACGVIIVALRDDCFYVVDGQNRVLAAKRRSDITKLPCIVFESGGKKEEAKAFIDTNTCRKAVSARDKFRAAVVAEDETAIFIKNILETIGVTLVSHSTKSVQHSSINCIAALQKLALVNRDVLVVILSVAKEICLNRIIPERLIYGLFYLAIHTNIEMGGRLRERLLKVTIP